MRASKVLSEISSKREQKKKEELEITNQFLIRLQYPANIILSSEKPDFEVQIQGKLIGVENTEYYSDFTNKGSNERKKWSSWMGFNEKIRNELRKMDSQYDYIYGVVHSCYGFDDFKILLKLPYINELKDLIINNKLNIGENLTIKIADKHPFLKKYIDSISLWNTFPEKNAWWESSLQSGSLESSDKSVRNIIENKNPKTKNYRDQYFQKWLIIYAKGHGLNDVYVENNKGRINRQGKVLITEITEERVGNYNTYDSHYFTHIYLWDKFSETIYLVHPYRKKIFYPKDNKVYNIHINHLPIKRCNYI